ncbi:TonB-dependent hemoglobin/transferrin/lactoferrin family receptor, partial [Neisseria meningitidis]|nr:TonB-dependent hemoglobin/transferrin/lactoferrin family receptor [Neisseria meningitidis]
DDVNRRRNTNLFYEWTPESDRLSMVKADVDYQKTKVSAVNYKGSFPIEDSSTLTRNYNQKDLDEIYNRSMDTRFKRITLRLDSHPLQLGGG